MSWGVNGRERTGREWKDREGGEIKRERPGRKEKGSDVMGRVGNE